MHKPVWGIPTATFVNANGCFVESPQALTCSSQRPHLAGQRLSTNRHRSVDLLEIVNWHFRPVGDKRGRP